MLNSASRLDVINRLGRAMADPSRARILLMLLHEAGYPAQLARDLDLSRPNVSNHLACLRGCGIVVAAPEGRRTRYEIADVHLTRALESLLEVVLAVEDGNPCTDEDCDLPLCCGSTSTALPDAQVMR
ncbi:Cd(II)/Pb(II)-sensing metalloregulatory transcriptional regulator CmtR [Janibacter alittae]|uniref:Winged helix-turn-helix domain-containing protein n=1 Tax=Janibacter alittae TaxID=3115209 RepID=A0ABZ2MHK1_9MICO